MTYNQANHWCHRIVEAGVGYAPSQVTIHHDGYNPERFIMLWPEQKELRTEEEVVIFIEAEQARQAADPV